MIGRRRASIFIAIAGFGLTLGPSCKIIKALAKKKSAPSEKVSWARESPPAVAALAPPVGAVRRYGEGPTIETSGSLFATNDTGDVVAFVRHERDHSFIEIRDQKSGATVAKCKPETDQIEALGLSGDAKIAVIGDYHGHLEIFDAKTGDKKKSVAASEHLEGLAVSPDGERIAVAGDDDLVVVDASSGETKWHATPETVMAGGASAVAFSPNGKQIAVGGWFVVELYDASSGKLVKKMADNYNLGPIHSLSFSADGTVLAAASFEKGTWLFDVKSGDAKRLLTTGDEAKSSPKSAVFLPDGKHVAITDGGAVSVFDAQTGEVSSVLHQPIAALVRSTDGSRLFAVAGSVENIGTDPSAWEKPRGHAHSVGTLAYSSDGKFLASSDSRRLILWDTGSGTITRTIDAAEGESFGGVAWDTSGSTLALGTSETLRLLDAATGEKKKEIDGNPGERLAFTPDGAAIAGHAFNETRLFDVANGTPIDLGDGGPQGVLLGVGSGRTVVMSACPDGPISIVDLATKKAKKTMVRDKDLGCPVAASLASKLLINFGKSAAIVDLDKGTRLRALDASGPMSVEFTTDGKTLVATAEGDLVFFNTASGKVTKTQKLPMVARTFAVSPDGKRVATGHDDGEVLEWSVP